MAEEQPPNRAVAGVARDGGPAPPMPTTPPRGQGGPCRVAGKYCYFPAPSELDVRVAPHPAQAFTNAPRGTRPLWSVVLARGSADGSWHATTPSCPPCPDRLGCARSDGGSRSHPLLSAEVDHIPHIVPLLPSIRIRSTSGLPPF